jgi:hypothetical protein
MLFLLPGFAWSVFLPASIFKSPPTRTHISFENLTNKITQAPFLAVIALRQSDSSFAKTFFSAQQNFPDLTFESISFHDFRTHNSNVPPSPALAIYKNGSLICLQGPIDSESVLAQVLELHYRSESPVLPTFSGALSGAVLTVIGRLSQSQVIRDFARSSRVPTNVIVISEESATSLELAPSECAVYRRDDNILSKFECTLDNYASNSIPLYSSVTDRTSFLTGRFVFVRLEEPAPIVANFLSDLGAAYPDFHFAHIPRTHTYIATRLLNKPFGDFPVNVAVFDFPEKSHYNISHLIPEFDPANLAFDPNAWRLVIDAIVSEVRAGKATKVYLSEAETARISGTMQRLAGTNFVRTVYNDSADVFVLFEKAKCRTCPQAYESYSRFAVAVSGNVGYELDYIAVSGNRIAGGFPVATVPAIVLYPAKNKSAVRVCPYESYDVIAWFAQKYATEKHNVSFELPDEETIRKIEERAEVLARFTTKELAQGLAESVRELKSEAAVSGQRKEL